MLFALILALILAILAVFFALENTMVVTVSFFGYAIDGTLALFILIALAIGVLVGVLVMIPGRIKSGISNARNRKKISTLESNLDEQRIELSAMKKLVDSASQPDYEDH
jgi:uncharacterized integral membrane protein